MKPIELLAPAGDLEKLKIAIEYGADAVYCAGEEFGLRASAKNMSKEELALGVDFAHSRGKKVYLTINIYAHNDDLKSLDSYLDEISMIPFDAYVISDPGIFDWFHSKYPEAEIHLSTQANTTNYLAANFWHKQGVKRIVLARELSIAEISKLRKETPDSLELEAFVHGAMCISYSGRCLLSNFMTGRDANKGECTHPCRWKYSLVEEKRPDESFPIIEDSNGTYIMNSKDLCMILHIKDLIDAGIHSFKIEGRSKSIFYVASVINAYRKAIDAYQKGIEPDSSQSSWLTEVGRASHREFTTGFYYGKADQYTQNYETSQYTRDYTFLGVVLEYDTNSGFALVEQRNKINLQDEIEVFGPDHTLFTQRVEELTDEEGNPISSAPHPKQLVKIKMQQPVSQNFMVCTRK